MPATNDSPLGVKRLWTQLQELPPYAMATVTWRGRDYELMARGPVGKGQRFTCITTGNEWFINDELFANMGDEITSYSIAYGGKIR